MTGNNLIANEIRCWPEEPASESRNEQRGTQKDIDCVFVTETKLADAVEAVDVGKSLAGRSEVIETFNRVDTRMLDF